LLSHSVNGKIFLLSLQSHTAVPLRAQTRKRIIFQILFVIIVPALVALCFGAVYLSVILGYNLFETTFLQYEYPVAILVIIIINLVLLLMTLIKGYRHDPASEPASQADSRVKDILLVGQGSRKVPLDTADVAAIYKEGDLPVVFTFSGKQFVLNDSLDSVMESLDPRIFFRANRQAIVHLKVCGPFTVNRSGKIDLQLGSPLNREVNVSQKRAREFKNWITRS